MPHDPRKLLQDILDQAQSIQSFTSGIDIASYQTNQLLRLAVERQFEIIGEALLRLWRLDPLLTSKITDYRKIIDFRNAISHGYDAIDDQLVWDAIHFKLPLLAQETDALMKSILNP